MRIAGETQESDAIPTDKPDRSDLGDSRRKLRATRVEVDIEESSLGLVLVAREADGGGGICAVLIGDDRDALRSDLQRRFPDAVIIDCGDELRALARRVVEHMDSPSLALEVALDLRGTDFQRIVWRELQRIPAGATASYTEIARRIGRPNAVRAVANACAMNPVAVVVPCHRVIASNGGLAGYHWGIERKRALLEKESVL